MTLVSAVSLLVLVGLIRLYCQAILGIVEGCIGLFCCSLCWGSFWFQLRAWGSLQCCSSEGR